MTDQEPLPDVEAPDPKYLARMEEIATLAEKAEKEVLARPVHTREQRERQVRDLLLLRLRRGLSEEIETWLYSNADAFSGRMATECLLSCTGDLFGRAFDMIGESVTRANRTSVFGQVVQKIATKLVEKGVIDYPTPKRGSGLVDPNGRPLQ